MAIVFQWSGKTPKGIIESGEITAATKDEVIAQLRKRNITATVVIEKPKKVSKFGFGGKVKDKDI
ncbi:MAG: type II secretion system F family protein, partial [Nitrospirota bacterium]|nr:type II secretion system F family protein [Nitrospirota bacterium]